MRLRFLISVLMVLFFVMSSASAASHRPQEFLQSIRGAKDEGAQIYAHYCANCHAVNPVIALGAPRIGAEDDWRPRLKQGMDVLFKNTSEGINAMPARGGCFECSDRQLILAIKFMIKNQDQKNQ